MGYNVKIIMRTLFISLLLLVPIVLLADQARWKNTFVSENRNYELRFHSRTGSKERWLLIDRRTTGTKYEIFEELLGTRTVLVGDNGTDIVVLDDRSARKPAYDLDVLVFYKNGVVSKRYTLGDLLENTTNISYSTSHFTWFFRRKPIYKGMEPIHKDGSLLFLKTYELVDFQFDVPTGTLLEKKNDPRRVAGSLHVYGKVTKVSGDRYQMEICHLASGAPPPPQQIEFILPKELYDYTSNDGTKKLYNYTSVVIKGGQALSMTGVTLNQCNYDQ